MDELKEGEYIRLEYDGIGKILEVRYNPLRYVYDIHSNIAFPEDIADHNSKIIELVKPGDYVNGYLIVDSQPDPFVYGQRVLTTQIFKYNGWGDMSLVQFHEEDIETVVTKEQFKISEYSVREDE